MRLGLMRFSAVREAAIRTEERAGEVLGCLLGPKSAVRIQGAERLENGALPSLLEAIQSDGPCLCGTIAGDVEGRLVVWPPVPVGGGENELYGKHEVIAESVAQGLMPALAELSGMRMRSGTFRLKHEMCSLPEEWDGEAEAWVLTVHLRHNSKRYRLRVGLFAPASDALSLYRALCLEEAA